MPPYFSEIVLLRIIEVYKKLGCKLCCKVLHVIAYTHVVIRHRYHPSLKN
jgi:hypothetical protein